MHTQYIHLKTRLTILLKELKVYLNSWRYSYRAKARERKLELGMREFEEVGVVEERERKGKATKSRW